MRQCTKYVSTVCFLLRQSLRTLATGAGSLALLLALLALVELLGRMHQKK